MKYVIFLRHGKAEHYSFDKKDFDRDLSKRGIRNSEQIAQILQHSKIIPDIVICSPANRTLQTAQIFADNIGFPSSKIKQEDVLYDHVGVGELLQIVGQQDHAKNTLLIVGHNPWISSICSSFTSGFYQELPTTGMVCLAFDVKQWTEIEARSGKLEFYEYPKKYD